MAIHKVYQLELSWDHDNGEALLRIYKMITDLEDTTVSRHSLSFFTGGSACPPYLEGFFETEELAEEYAYKVKRIVSRFGGTLEENNNG